MNKEYNIFLFTASPILDVIFYNGEAAYLIGKTMIKTKLDFKLKHLSSGKEFELDKSTYLIGREKDCDIQLKAGNPSRMHAQIIYKNGQLLLDDLNSKNGTFVNNKRISTATPISPGDIISFSTNEFTLLSSDPEADTIISKKPLSNKRIHSFIVDSETELDPNETALQHDYPLPAGWRADDTFIKTLFKKEPTTKADYSLDRLIKDTLSDDDTVYIGALIFNPHSDKPIIFGLTVEMQQRSLSVGRSHECTFTINDPSVSEHHANLTFKKGKWHITDNKSTNGIKNHREHISTKALDNGTTLSLGQIKMVYRHIPWAL